MKQIPGCEEVTVEDVQNWLVSDDVEKEVTDQDLIQIISEQHNEEYSDEENPPEDVSSTISHADGLKALETALMYVEQQANATPTDTLLKNRWRDIAAKNRMSNKLRQLSITTFVS
jgi:hypothetical protein